MNHPSFLEFVGNPLIRNGWIQEPGTIDIYVRRVFVPTMRYGADIELANMTAEKPGKGALTAFLNRYEPLFRFYVENVMNPRLYDYLIRRGYQIVSGSSDREDGGPDDYNGEFMSHPPCMVLRR